MYRDKKNSNTICDFNCNELKNIYTVLICERVFINVLGLFCKKNSTT